MFELFNFLLINNRFVGTGGDGMGFCGDGWKWKRNWEGTGGMEMTCAETGGDRYSFCPCTSLNVPPRIFLKLVSATKLQQFLISSFFFRFWLRERTDGRTDRRTDWLTYEQTSVKSICFVYIISGAHVTILKPSNINV